MCTQGQAISILNEVYDTCSSIFTNNIKDAYLYGSYARGDYTNESDIDILLTVDCKREDIYKYRSLVGSVSSDLSLKHDLTVSITVKPHSEFVLNSSVLPFYSNVMKEGIKYEG